jgi:ArsR family transcriptional regulator
MIMNMSDYTPETNPIAESFSLLSQPSRLLILLAIGEENACVCHLEAVLGMRQAYISQQLMLLRAAGVVKTERSGRHIFYSLADPRWLALIRQAAELKGVTLPQFDLPCIEGCVYTPKPND